MASSSPFSGLFLPRFGRVTAEALMSSNPVIGADTGGTPELIQDGENATDQIFYSASAFFDVGFLLIIFVTHSIINHFQLIRRNFILKFLCDRSRNQTFFLVDARSGRDAW